MRSNPVPRSLASSGLILLLSGLFAACGTVEYGTDDAASGAATDSGGAADQAADAADTGSGDTGDTTDTPACGDDDDDGVCNTDDVCPGSPDDLDDDSDGVPDDCDLCPGHRDGEDADADRVPDGCDVCPLGDDNEDEDADETPDACDCDDTDVCHDDAYCTPDDDSIICTCNSGYDGNGIDECENIDECLASPCGSGATCEDNDGGYVCRCPQGYTSDDPYTERCAEVNECTTDAHDCDPVASCTNEPLGSWTCECPVSGYEDVNSDGTECREIDECTEGGHDCGANSICSNAPPGSWTCTCPESGYEDLNEDGTECREIDECTEGGHDCDDVATCENSPLGSWTCECPEEGYNDENEDGTECVEINECNDGSDSCDTVATCENTPPGSHTCTCPETGYNDVHGDGSVCEDINECASSELNDCDPVATCADTPAGSYTCSCPDTGYTDVHGDGTVCQDVNECASGELNNCDSVATCANEPAGSFTCTCPETGYTDVHGDGTVCQDVNECASGELNDCDAVAACANTPAGSYTCTCPETGYEDVHGDGTVCQDINECASSEANNCDDAATCANTPAGSYTCTCPATGYVDVNGDGTVCQDINECASSELNNCDDTATCTNTPAGSFTCACPATGYIDVNDNGTLCQDINECASADLNDCDEVASCANTPAGSYTCSCPDTGYDDVDGDGTDCQDIDECADPDANDCDAAATCENTPAGSYTCTCPETGYEDVAENGTDCREINECTEGGHNCESASHCTNTPAGSWTCSCPGEGYSGNGTAANPCVPILTIEFGGTGRGDVFDRSGVFECVSTDDETCAAALDAGTVVDLAAAGLTGSAFVSWTNVPCDSAACSVTTGETPLTITVTFDIAQNLVFVADVDIVPGDLGDSGSMLAAGDLLCRQQAALNDLPGTYMAWLSDDTGAGGSVSAIDRLTLDGVEATGWIRLDGIPFAATVSQLENHMIYHPIRYAANGSPTTGTIFTGTTRAGLVGNTCGGGADNSATGTAGLPYTSTFSDGGSVGCNGTADLFCLGVDAVSEVSPDGNGLYAFVSDAYFAIQSNQGPVGGNAQCQAEANAAGLPGQYRTLLKLSDFSPAEWVVGSDGSGSVDYGDLATYATATDRSGHWMRPDGARLSSSIASFFTGDLLAAPSISASLTSYDISYAWTGAHEDGLDSAVAEPNCQDWRRNDGGGEIVGTVGQVSRLDFGFYRAVSGAWCSTQAHLYCLETRPNGIINGSFDDDVNDWTFDGGGAYESNIDRHGLRHSGSLGVFTTTEPREAAQCVPVCDGDGCDTAFRVKAWVTAQTASDVGRAMLQLYQYSTDDCTGGIAATTIGTDNGMPDTDTWRLKDLNPGALADGVRSVRIVLRSWAFDEVAYLVYWDEILLHTW